MSAFVRFVDVEPEKEADRERSASSRDHEKTATSTEEYHDCISALEDSIDIGELKEAHFSVKKSEGEPAQELEGPKIVKTVISN